MTTLCNLVLVDRYVFHLAIEHARHERICASVPVVEAQPALEEVADGVERRAEEPAAAILPLVVVVVVLRPGGAPYALTSLACGFQYDDAGRL
jgi:hypothetical protein